MSPRTEAPTVPTGAAAASFATASPIPGLLLAWAPAEASPTDRAAIGAGLGVGRSREAGWRVRDERLSGTHFRVRPFGEAFLVEDLGSTNGTYVGGVRVQGAREAAPGAVVRAGRAIFVLSPDLGALEATAAPPPELAGRFHSPPIARAVELAARTNRHVLLSGESGTGKEICARMLHARLPGGSPFVVHNCARFASDDDAETTLFGVGGGTFSGVEARAGLLEKAEGGLLFLDEFHVLPVRVQRSLLRFVEDEKHARIGSVSARTLGVRIAFGTNVPVGAGGIADDLVARLETVSLPSLADRRADVPEIFLHALRALAAQGGVDAAPIVGALGVDHLEALSVADFSQRNVRALEAIASAVIAKVSMGTPPSDALALVLGERLQGSAVVGRSDAAAESPSTYERERERIVAAYRAAGENLSETERALRASGLRLSRRWIAEFLRRWGIRRPRGRRG